MRMQDSWVPTSGDRIQHTVTIFGDPLDAQIWPDMSEILILRKESSVFGYWHACNEAGESRTLTTEQMVKETCEWHPWPHQIIDYLVRQHRMNLMQVLCALGAITQYKPESTFEELCSILLADMEQTAENLEFQFSSKLTPTN